MKALILDGAGLSPPYDFSLSAGLSSIGVDNRLVILDEVQRVWRDPDAMPSLRGSRVATAARRVVKTAAYSALLRQTYRTIVRERPDVLHVQWMPLPLLDLALLRALADRLPLVYTMHNTSSLHEPTGGLRGWGKADAFAVFDRIVVHSAHSARSAKAARLVRDDQLRVIPHGAFDYYRQLVTETSRSDAPVRLLFAGSIKHYKGLDVLIEALAELQRSAPPGSWRLTVAGHPSMPVAPIRERAVALGVDGSIDWHLHHQTERELANHFAGAHVVVLPYREIDQSGVLLTAVGMHRPIVATSVGAFPEIIQQDVHGLLVPPHDPTALAHALVRMVADPALRSRCERELAALAMGALHWSSVARQTLAMYEELQQSRRSR